MSSGGDIGFCINSIIELVNAIKDLKLAYKEKSQMTTFKGKTYNVDVVIKDNNNREIGFQKQKDGSYKIIADSAGLNAQQTIKQKTFINKVRRRFAYNKIITELKDEGYQVVEEKQDKNTVKLLARRWVK